MDTGKLIDSMKRVVKSELGSYDTTATVKRVEGNTAWVHIPGGVDETPVRLTMNAKEGDNVQVRVSDGKAFLAGNVSAPPTDDTTAEAAKALANRAAEDAGRAKSAADIAESYATSAQASAAQSANILEGMEQAAIAAGTTLDGIYADAAEAKATTDEINTYADTAGKTVTQILNDGETAGAAAQAASEAANSALVGLSTVEDVVGVLNWITEHGTMTLTSDVTVNPAHVYFIVDPAGDYVVGGTHYSIVSEPDDADISTYYELSVDESVQNYVATHIVVDSEGLWIIPDAGGNKVLIATGSGSTYTTAGTYIVGTGNVTLASFTANGAAVGREDQSRLEITSDSLSAFNEESVKFFDIDYDGGQTTETTTKRIGALMRFDYAPRYCTSASANPDFNAGSDSRTIADYDGYSFSVKEDGWLSFQYAYSDTAVEVTSHNNCEVSYFLNTINIIPTLPELIVGTTSSFSVTSTFSVKIARSGGTYSYCVGKIVVSYDSTNKRLTQEIYYPSTGTEYISGRTYSGIRGYLEKSIVTTAPAYTLGTDAGDSKGSWSARMGQSLKAESDNQTAIGMYNDNQSGNAFEIGNGTADDARSNALTVDWSGNVEAAGGIMAVGMAGMIQMFAGSTAPTGWLICDGSAVSRTTYATLFSVIGTTYGTGDGSTTFNLPDFRGRVGVGVGNGTATGHTNHTLGQMEGNEDAIVPYHQHTMAHTHNTSTSGEYYVTSGRTIANAAFTVSTSGNYRWTVGYDASGVLHTRTATAGSSAANTGYAGTSGNVTGANMQPYLGINYIICTGKF